MKLPYRNGKSADDPFFDASLEDQQARMATYLALSPNHKSSWPMDLIDNLIALRRHEGEEAMLLEINKMFSR